MDSFSNNVTFTIICILSSFSKTGANFSINFPKYYSLEITIEIFHICEIEENKYFTL